MFYLEIQSGRNSTYRYRKKLFRNGFSLIRKSSGKAFFSKKVTKAECKKWEWFCRWHGLRSVSYNTRYVRSNDYRENFLSTISSKKVFCAYCGTRIPISKITVDHIIPIQKAKTSKSARFLLMVSGINNVNDTRNLVCSCRLCNSRKGTKTGFWIIKGVIGKNQWLWYIRWGIRIVIALTGIVFSVMMALYFAP